MKTNHIFKIIYIEWCDSVSNDSNWMDVANSIDWVQEDDWVIRQTGFVIKETKEYLLLASKLNANPQNPVQPMLRGLIKIPKTWVRKRIDLTKKIY